MTLSITVFSQNAREKFWDPPTLFSPDGQHREIDPRQYVQVIYSRHPNYTENIRLEEQRLIWNWDQDGLVQRFKVLDNEGHIRIYFKKDSLANNWNFRGNISLEAFLKGKDGERKIEVGPYSLVGVDRKEIGIQSQAPTMVAQLLFNSIMEMKRTIVRFQGLRSRDTLFSQMDEYKSISVNQGLIREENKSDLGRKIDRFNPSLKSLLSYTTGDQTGFYDAIAKYKIMPERFTYRELLNDVAKITSDYEAYLRISEKEFRRQLTDLKTRLNLVNKYLTEFEKAGPDAVKAFLDLASKDKINFGFLKANLATQEKKLEEVLSSPSTNSELTILSNWDNINLVKAILENLNNLSSIEGSKMEQLIWSSGTVTHAEIMRRSSEIRNELEEEYGKITEEEFRSNFEKLDSNSFMSNKFTRYIILRLLEKSNKFEQYKRDLSSMAAEIIYSKLVYATIDLGKSGAQPGDILYLNVVWKDIDGTGEGATNGSLLPIGKYFLRQTGWRTEISESFYLVERFNEPQDRPNVSKSNFKGAYGASIMRTFYYSENYQKNGWGKFMNWLQPSFGFNISYLDFFTDKDIEIGAGLQLGLFKNVFFFGSGINLHGIRGADKHSSMYFSFGVSFTNIAEKFKTKENSEAENK